MGAWKRHLVMGVVLAAAAGSAGGCKKETTGTDAGGGGTDASGMCAPTGDACEDCVAASCCTESNACYGDTTCAAADETFDTCIGGAGADLQTCWQTFAATNAIANTYAQCKSTSCGAECAVPSTLGDCTPNTGDDCDDCQNTYCCVERYGCYGDAGCNAADTTLDGCLAANPPDPTACWQTFNDSGTLAADRVSCAFANCMAECMVPMVM